MNKGGFLLGRSGDILHALDPGHPFATEAAAEKRENLIRWEAPP